MRYPVGDAFAADLAEEVYEGILERKHDLPRALQRALPKLGAGPDQSPLSIATPTLFGAPAAGLSLKPPPGKLSTRPEIAHLPKPDPLFVGRVNTLAWASSALAVESGKTG